MLIGVEQQEIRKLLIPTLRADFAMDEGYRPRGGAPLDVPMTAVCAADDSFVTRDEVAKWRDVTTARFSLADLSGGHMYLADDAEPLLDLISRTIAGERAESGGLPHETA